MSIVLGAYSQLSSCTPHSILDRALVHVYKPLLTHVYKNPQLMMHLYVPGTILEWFEQNHPEMNMLIADLVKKEQLEMLTGAFYQPILHTLMAKDRSTQIEMTTTFIRKRFGKRARSAWLFHQIWNPTYISTLSLSTVERLIISTYSQFHKNSLYDHPFMMQDMGKCIEIVPVHSPLSSLFYRVGNQQMGAKEFKEQLIQLSGDIAQSQQALMINLDQLLAAEIREPLMPTITEIIELLMGEKKETIQTHVLSSLPFGSFPTRGYLPAGWYGFDSTTSSTSSINENFLRYEELHHMYGRFLYVHELSRLFRKNKDTKKRVESLLLKASCGNPYILDSSGGCYRHLYRKFIYRALNEAEHALSITEGISYPREVDIDFDGKPEIVWMGKHIGVIIDSKGGALREINYLPTGWNYQDTFTGYKEEGERLSAKHLPDGAFQRSFCDVLFPEGTAITSFDLYQEKYTHSLGQCNYDMEYGEKNGAEISTSFAVDQLPFGIGSLTIEKTYRLRTQTIVIEFSIKNRGAKRSKGLFGSELNLCIGTKSQGTQVYTVEKSRNRVFEEGKVVTSHLKNVRIGDELNKTIVSFASDARFHLLKDDYCVQLATVMGSEVLYEHTKILPVWEFDLEPKEQLSWTIGFRIERRSRSQSIHKE